MFAIHTLPPFRVHRHKHTRYICSSHESQRFLGKCFQLKFRRIEQQQYLSENIVRQTARTLHQNNLGKHVTCHSVDK